MNHWFQSQGRNLSLLLLLALADACLPTALADTARQRATIEQMKQSPRGPFSRIRWFCNDGTVLPPEPFVCRDHGGGTQHGEWSKETRRLRADGYRIATIYADLDIDQLIHSNTLAVDLGQMIIEQFLIRIDDGWILRKARYYRGAFQEEDERDGARRLLLRLFRDPDYVRMNFLQLRMAANLLSHGNDTASIQSIRLQVTSLADQDPGFAELRNKIHTRPDARDAQRVDAYAAGIGDPELRQRLTSLATQIRTVYERQASHELDGLLQLMEQYNLHDLAKTIQANRPQLQKKHPARQRFKATAAVLQVLRDAMPLIPNPSGRLQAMETSSDVEAEYFIAAQEYIESLAGQSRREYLLALNDAARALYGAGLISSRELQALETSLTALLSAQTSDADAYQREINYLALPASWGVQHYRFHFGRAEARLAEIEPLANLFIQNQVRGSPLFNYASLINTLLLDVHHFAGHELRLFGSDVGIGLRALNPGLAKGVLLAALPGQQSGKLREDGIYLLPETTPDLPPVAGIITTSAGNPLSHVQLLARNLGIPNVSITPDLRTRLIPHIGQPVVMAVSPDGSVVIAGNHGQWDKYFDQASVDANRQYLIYPDLNKLDLQTRHLIPLGALRKSDSGRIVGPKAAKLGELKQHYPDAVADGLAIPFGVFRKLLDSPMADSGQTVFEWLVDGYRHLESLPTRSQERRQAAETLRSRLHDWILNADPGNGFRQYLRAAMAKIFGKDGSYGVFIRSDTNVEDLPRFTGAGLNLTLPNVIDFDTIYASLNKVWASPFTARAFAWRQEHMRQPEYVFPAILLQRAVNVDKSGVMVTEDIETGDRHWISVAVNEGVGGAVEGQAAESLRINLNDGRVRLLAQATAPLRRQLDPRGGLVNLPASGRDFVLSRDEIERLTAFARTLPTEYPAVTDDVGQPAPFDVEFGFLGGKLYLFQIRPYPGNQRTRANALLHSLDAGATSSAQGRIDLDAGPDSGPGEYR
jgi:hypothetical protein